MKIDSQVSHLNNIRKKKTNFKLVKAILILKYLHWLVTDLFFCSFFFSKEGDAVIPLTGSESKTVQSQQWAVEEMSFSM